MKIEFFNSFLHVILIIIGWIVIQTISVYSSYYIIKMIRGRNIADVGVGSMFEYRDLAFWTGILIYTLFSIGMLFVLENVIFNSRWIIRLFALPATWISWLIYTVYLFLKYS